MSENGLSQTDILLALVQVEASAEANTVSAIKKTAMLAQARAQLEGKLPPP